MLADRRIVVVGATGGIGSAVVAELLANGARLLATGRSASRLRELERAGTAVHRLELGDPEAPAALAAAAAERFGGALDGLVVAAGAIGPIGPTRNVALDDLARTIEEGPLAALALVQACAGLLDAGASPSVVLFSGGGATDALPRYTAYALAKVAIVRLVENLAAEEPAWKVNAVAPGFVATGIHAATLSAGPTLAGPYHDETKRRLDDPAPVSAAAELVSFLLSDASDGISGRLISAIWDSWREESCRELLAADPSFGRLRRIDRQRFFEAESVP